jgi:hypothetical protein
LKKFCSATQRQIGRQAKGLFLPYGESALLLVEWWSNAHGFKEDKE